MCWDFFFIATQKNYENFKKELSFCSNCKWGLLCYTGVLATFLLLGCSFLVLKLKLSFGGHCSQWCICPSVSGIWDLSAEASGEPAASGSCDAKVCANRWVELSWCVSCPYKGELILVRSQKTKQYRLFYSPGPIDNLFLAERAENSAPKSRLPKWHSVVKNLRNKSVVVSRRVSHQKGQKLGSIWKELLPTLQV